MEKSWIWWYMPTVLVMREYKIGGSQSRLAWAKNETLSPKITRVKTAGSVAQAAEHLPQKHEALNSNSSTVKKKKKQKPGLALT
jgi:hypothetical protein